MSEEEPIVIQKDSIKLTKNTKGYQWEIKLLKEPNESVDAYLTRLALIDNKLISTYGGSND